MTYAKKTDKNQTEIVEALRAVGVDVYITSDVGRGFPDLVCGYNGKTYLLEIKTMKGRMTDSEKAFHACWKGHCAVVRNVQQALKVCGIEVE